MTDRLPVQKIIAATEVRNKLGELLSRVYRWEEHLVVEKLGIPVAAIISMKEYEQFRRLLAQQQLLDLGRKVGAEADRLGLTEDKLQEELAQTRKGERASGSPIPPGRGSRRSTFSSRTPKAGRRKPPRRSSRSPPRSRSDGGRAGESNPQAPVVGHPPVEDQTGTWRRCRTDSPVGGPGGSRTLTCPVKSRVCCR